MHHRQDSGTRPAAARTYISPHAVAIAPRGVVPALSVREREKVPWPHTKTRRACVRLASAVVREQNPMARQSRRRRQEKTKMAAKHDGKRASANAWVMKQNLAKQKGGRAPYGFTQPKRPKVAASAALPARTEAATSALVAPPRPEVARPEVATEE
jgi:hypothetical protein